MYLYVVLLIHSYTLGGTLDYANDNKLTEWDPSY